MLSTATRTIGRRWSSSRAPTPNAPRSRACRADAMNDWPVGTGEGGALWRLTATAPDEAAANALAAAFASAAGAVSAFETRPGGAWRIEAYAERPPDRAALEAAGALASMGFGIAGSGLL